MSILRAALSQGIVAELLNPLFSLLAWTVCRRYQKGSSQRPGLFRRKKDIEVFPVIFFSSTNSPLKTHISDSRNFDWSRHIISEEVWKEKWQLLPHCILQTCPWCCWCSVRQAGVLDAVCFLLRSSCEAVRNCILTHCIWI